jgi:hypothetical protein
MFTDNDKWAVLSLLLSEIRKEKIRMYFALRERQDFDVLKKIDNKITELQIKYKELFNA